MIVKIDAIANWIPQNVDLVCELLQERIEIILGQYRIKKIDKIIFCVSAHNFKIEKLNSNKFVVGLNYKLLKNALQAGEGQKIFDETILSVKSKIS